METQSRTGSEYTAIWESQVEPGARDAVGSSRTVAPAQTADGDPAYIEGTGPISSRLEGTGWTRDDVEIVVDLLTAVMMAITLYSAVRNGGMS
jgi:hypothetical protein